MQKKTKYSLLFAISALIIGAPAYLLSQVEQDQASIKHNEKPLLSSSANAKQYLQKINQSPHPAAGIHSITQQNPLPDQALEENYDSPIERIKAIQNKSELHEALIKDHEQFTRYAENNSVFDSPEQDPVVKRYEVEERTTQSEEDESSLTIWSDKKYYLPGETATVFASLRNAEGQAIPTSFMGQLIFNEKESLQTFQFTDTNQDGIYENILPLEHELSAGLYKVLIVNSQNKVSDALTFILSEPEIQLTGNFKDIITKNGELLIQAEVMVSSNNRFYFQASLYTSNLLPIGSTQQAVELSLGKHWVDLVFDGRMIKDSGESGPFLLKNISLAKVTVPMQRAPLQTTEYLTQHYALNQFDSSNGSQSDNLQTAQLKH